MSARAGLLLHVLCVCVRLLTRDQAMRLLGFTDEANYKRFVRGLVARGLVSPITVWAKPVPEMREPLFVSCRRTTTTTAIAEMGNGRSEVTDYCASEPLSLDVASRVLRLAHARWADVSALPTPCIVATRRAGQIYGVERSRPLAHVTQSSHDLTVSEVLLALLHDRLIQVEDWQGEDWADDASCGNKRVDALIVRNAGSPRPEIHKAVEIVGGDYTYDKILTIARECNARGLSYEFW